MNWTKCKECHLVIKTPIDINKINNLLTIANNKAVTANSIILTNITKESIFTLLYDSLRTLLEALAIKNGFKIYNHDCYSAFLIEELNKKTTGNMFNIVRQVRNKINYYGETYSLEHINENIMIINSIIEKIKIII
jgi:hypothetical protein